MIKIHKFILMLVVVVAGIGTANATKIFADLSKINANNWDSESKTYSWTWNATYGNQAGDLGEGFNGDLSGFTKLGIYTESLENADFYRLLFYTINSGSNAVLTIKVTNEGLQEFNLSEAFKDNLEDLKIISRITLSGSNWEDSKQGAWAETPAKAVISKAYLEKPTDYVHGRNGEIVIYPSDFTVSGTNVEFDESTGTITATEGSGSLSINLPAEGIDLTYLTGFKINYSGDGIFNNFNVGNKGFWSNVMGRDDLEPHMTTENIGDLTKVTTLRWNIGSVGTVAISNITLKFSTITATDPHYIPLTKEMYNNSNCELNLGSSAGTIYGLGTPVEDSYVDVSSYQKLVMKGKSGDAIRMFYNTVGGQQKIVGPISFEEDGEIVIDFTKEEDLKDLEHIYLNAIKGPNGWTNATVYSINLYKENVNSKFNYSLTGKGILLESVITALADESATSMDATGLTGTNAIELVTANPNCLIKAAQGKISNANNVIVNGTCANLVLTDSKPFAAPETFTAANVTFTKKVGSANFATMVLPFSAELPAGVEAYNITNVEGTDLIAEKVNSIVADKPVLLKNSGDFEFTATDAEIAVPSGYVVNNGLLYGTYATTDVPTVNSYVLQNKASGVSFYKVSPEGGITVNAFRAYLSLPTESSAKALNFFIFDETTGISVVKPGMIDSENVIYNLNGQRITNPTNGLYIVNGNKVIIK